MRQPRVHVQITIKIYLFVFDVLIPFAQAALAGEVLSFHKRIASLTGGYCRRI
jgi:hypothetical protein